MPGLGGPDTSSRASDIYVRSDDQKIVVGASQLPNGKWRATLWQQADGGEWQAHDMGALRNAQSNAQSFCSATRPHNDGLFAVGSSFVNSGRSRGVIFWMDFSGALSVGNLGVPGDFLNSSASDGLWFPGGTSSVSSLPSFRVVGSAWTDFNIHDPGMSAGVVWSGFRIEMGEIEIGEWVVRSYPLTALLEDESWQPIILSAIGDSGVIVGDGIYGSAGDDLFHALVMTPTNVHMPDAMRIRRGRAAKSSSVENSWWADGELLGIFAGHYDTGNLVDVTFEYHIPFAGDDANEILIDLTAEGVTKPRRDGSWQRRSCSTTSARSNGFPSPPVK